MDDVVNALERRDGGASGGARVKAARHLDKGEGFALKNYKGLDFGVLEGEALAEDGQGAAVDSDKPRSGVVDGFAEDGTENRAKKVDAERAEGAGVIPGSIHEAGADDHLAAGGSEGFVNARDVVGIVLAIAIDANDIFVAEFEGEFVAGLYAAAQAKVMGERDDVRAGEPGLFDGGIFGAIVDDEDRRAASTRAFAPGSLQAGTTTSMPSAAAEGSVPGCERFVTGDRIPRAALRY